MKEEAKADKPPIIVDISSFILRVIKEPAVKGKSFRDFKDVLDCVDYPSLEPVIEWPDLAQYAALDVDFHAEHKPKVEELETFLILLKMPAVCGWVTHGGGLRLITRSVGHLTAEEVAALLRVLLNSTARL